MLGKTHRPSSARMHHPPETVNTSNYANPQIICPVNPLPHLMCFVSLWPLARGGRKTLRWANVAPPTMWCDNPALFDFWLDFRVKLTVGAILQLTGGNRLCPILRETGVSSSYMVLNGPEFRCISRAGRPIRLRTATERLHKVVRGSKWNACVISLNWWRRNRTYASANHRKRKSQSFRRLMKYHSRTNLRRRTLSVFVKR